MMSSNVKKLPPSVEGYDICNNNIQKVLATSTILNASNSNSPLPSIPRGTCSDLSKFIEDGFNEMLTNQNAFNNLPAVKASRKEEVRASDTLGNGLLNLNFDREVEIVKDNNNSTISKLMNNSFEYKLDLNLNYEAIKKEEFSFLPPVDIGQRIRISIPPLSSPSLFDIKVRERGLSSPIPMNVPDMNKLNTIKEQANALQILTGGNNNNNNNNNNNSSTITSSNKLAHHSSEFKLRYQSKNNIIKKLNKPTPPPLSLPISNFKLINRNNSPITSEQNSIKGVKRISKRSTLNKRILQSKLKNEYKTRKGGQGQLKLMNPDNSPKKEEIITMNINDSINNTLHEDVKEMTMSPTNAIREELSFNTTMSSIPSPPLMDPPILSRKSSEPRTALISMLPPPPPVLVDNKEENMKNNKINKVEQMKDKTTINKAGSESSETIQELMSDLENEHEHEIKDQIMDLKQPIINKPQSIRKLSTSTVNSMNSNDSVLNQFPLPPTEFQVSPTHLKGLRRSLSQPNIRFELSNLSDEEDSFDSYKLHSILSIGKRVSMTLHSVCEMEGSGMGINDKKFTLTPRDSDILKVREELQGFQIINLNDSMSSENSEIIDKINTTIDNSVNHSNLTVNESKNENHYNNNNNQINISPNRMIPDPDVLKKLNGQIQKIPSQTNIHQRLDVLINKEPKVMQLRSKLIVKEEVNFINKQLASNRKQNRQSSCNKNILYVGNEISSIENINLKKEVKEVKVIKVVNGNPIGNNNGINNSTNKNANNLTLLRNNSNYLPIPVNNTNIKNPKLTNEIQLHNLSKSKTINNKQFHPLSKSKTINHNHQNINNNNNNNKMVITKKATEQDLQWIGKLVESTEQKLNNKNKKENIKDNSLKRIFSKVKQFI
ncbi:hypothetical protein K502DRAFT_326363 [Neoconidiobolus thromboides FSU 785]|nr:hypothetical protein K502DRAFT_326363 [Neoconidiobolus thromboides FSU 785]